MNPQTLALIGLGAWFLFGRRARAETTETDPGDVAAGAVPESGADRQYGPGGEIIPIGAYESGQRVVIRHGYRYAFFYGRGPTPGTSWAITNPVGGGPNAAPWEYGRAGAGMKDGRGADIASRFRRSMPVGNTPQYGPVYPQLHALYTQAGGSTRTPGQHGGMPDGPVSPNSARYGTDYQAPNVPSRATRSLPGVLVMGADGPTPLVEAWYTVNYSGLCLSNGTTAGENPYRLFIGADHYTAAEKVGNRWVHVSFAEMSARMAWRQPGRGRFPRHEALRCNIQPGTQIWQTGPYGVWLDGATRGPNFDCTGSGYCAARTSPGQDRAFVQPCLDGAKLTAAGVPAVGGIPCPTGYYFPNRQGWPTNWTGRRTFFELGLFAWITATGTGRRQTGTPVLNPRAMRPITFDFPARRGDQDYLRSVNLLPYPPTTSRLIAELRAKTYVKHFPAE